jgi:transposase
VVVTDVVILGGGRVWAAVAGWAAGRAGWADQLIGELRKQVARLERLVSRNSGNSSMPPSTDDQPGNKPPECRARRGGGRRPGKQLGAPGAYLSWNDHPDKAIPHFPQGIRGCGKDLAEAADLGVRYSHQVTDLPEAVAETIQHDRHEVGCACGRRHVARAPPEAAGRPSRSHPAMAMLSWPFSTSARH